MTEKIRQTKLNAISAKLLHRKSKSNYELINRIVLFLTVITPLFFIAAQYISKDSNSEDIVNALSFILSIALIGVSVLSMILKVNDKIMTHKIGMKNNIYITNECDNLSNLSDGDLKWFYRYVSEIDNQDNDTFAAVKDEEKKETYRNALKEIIPGDVNVTCPMCKSSPWEFKKGDCQLCGNTKK